MSTSAGVGARVIERRNDPTSGVAGAGAVSWYNGHMTQQTALDAAEIAQRIVDELSDKHVEHIVLLDVSKVSGFTDYFVIGTATSERQMKAVVESLERILAEHGVHPRAREGRPESGWVLLDFNDVVVHLFSPDARAFYRLDELWSRLVPVVRFT